METSLAPQPHQAAWSLVHPLTPPAPPFEYSVTGGHRHVPVPLRRDGGRFRVTGFPLGEEWPGSMTTSESICQYLHHAGSGVLATRVVDRGVTCLCSDPGLGMTARTGPSHFTMGVTVPRFSEDRRNRNSGYEIQGVASVVCSAASPRVFAVGERGAPSQPPSRGRVPREVCTRVWGSLLLRNPVAGALLSPAPSRFCPVPGQGALVTGGCTPGVPLGCRSALPGNTHIHPAAGCFPPGGTRRDVMPPTPPHLAVPWWILSKSHLTSPAVSGFDRSEINQ